MMLGLMMAQEILLVEFRKQLEAAVGGLLKPIFGAPSLQAFALFASTFACFLAVAPFRLEKPARCLEACHF